MVQSVRAFLPAPGRPAELRAAFTGDPGRWLPTVRRTGPQRWVIRVSGLQFVCPVEVRLGEAWSVGRGTWRSLSWTPATEVPGDSAPARLLPALDGEVGLHELGGVATLVIEGRYRPPGGPIGAAVDSLALHRVAQATVERLLADIAGRLCAEGLLAGEESVSFPVEEAAPRSLVTTDEAS